MCINLKVPHSGSVNSRSHELNEGDRSVGVGRLAAGMLAMVVLCGWNSMCAAEADATLQRLIRKLAANRRWLRARPLGPLLSRPEPGHGFHVGGTFPMSSHPTGFASDTLGRPAGLTRVHAVDSSVLPSIPATTITFSVMANAHRIGTLAD